MWLDGSADAQKSTICHAVAQICVEQHLLSGSFSFRRTTTNPAGKHDASGLIATLIYQLLLHIPETRNHIAEKIAVDISILDSSWETQLDALLVQPLIAVAKNGFPQDSPPRLFIIDGLGECDDKTQCIVVESFTAALEKIPPNIPHKLLFSSRSESHLVAICRMPPVSAHLRRLRLDDAASSPESLELSLQVVESFTEVKERFHRWLRDSQAEVEEGQRAILSLNRDIQRLEKRTADAEKERDELLCRNKALEMEMGMITAANQQLRRDLDCARTELQKNKMSKQEVSSLVYEPGASGRVLSKSDHTTVRTKVKDALLAIPAPREPPPDSPQPQHSPPPEGHFPVKRSSFSPLSPQPEPEAQPSPPPGSVRRSNSLPRTPQPSPPPAGHHPIRRSSFDPLSLQSQPQLFSPPEQQRPFRRYGFNSLLRPQIQPLPSPVGPRPARRSGFNPLQPQPQLLPSPERHRPVGSSSSSSNPPQPQPQPSQPSSGGHFYRHPWSSSSSLNSDALCGLCGQRYEASVHNSRRILQV